jgi:hypothetical protein
MAEDEVPLQLEGVRAGHSHVRELAEAGGHAVYDRVLSEQPLDVSAGLFDAGNRRPGQTDIGVSPGDLQDVPKAKGITVDRYRSHSLRFHSLKKVVTGIGLRPT